jgi:YidC/Oxa1 family membrane protein insertase
MERRVLLAISLSFLVLFVYQTFVTPPMRPPGETGNVSPVQSTPAIAGVSPPGNVSPGSPSAPLPPVATVVGDPEVREIVVETARVRAVFTNQGGRLLHWQLKEYRNGAGEAMDLVPEVHPAPLPLPFSLRVEDAAITARLNQSLYKVTQNNTLLVFDLETTEGLRVQKTFTIAQDGYDLLFSANVQQSGQTLNPTIDWGSGLGDDIARAPAGSFFAPNYLYAPQAIYHRQGERNPDRIAANALGGGLTVDGQFLWAGIDDHYFLSAIVAAQGPVHLEYAPVTIASTSQPPQVGTYVSYSVRLSAPPTQARFFFGPKRLDALRDVDANLPKAIYFGMFSFLAVPLLGALRWIYGFVGNWGWAIIILTILINLVMFPLRHKSVVSMRKMQELQPQMKSIQDRYAKYKVTDPERAKMNSEVMELYKQRGVNPASGCVPMLLTMPFLFAFYSMLGQAIEIRGAEFVGWIHDLAAADPYYVLPLLTGATMFWQQWITPSTADPTQQKVMMIMPVMFTFIFMSQPSGLSLYWLVSQLWAIGQQYLTNYLIGPPKVHNVRPVGERVTKSTKSSKEPK